MDDQRDRIKKTVKTLSYATILIGAFVIFLVASLTHHYMGVEGDTWFQVYGIFTGIIIAHYVYRQVKFMREQEEDDVQD